MTLALHCGAALAILCIGGLTPVYVLRGLTPVYVRGSGPLVRTPTAGPVHMQQPRDGRIVVPTGTGAISGVVMSAERTPKPLRRTRVMLTGGDLALGQTTITADDGTFRFDRLPPGRYGVSATKDGYVSFSFGATGPNRPGTRIALGAGERRTLSLTLPKGAVITGVLTTADGQPLPGMPIVAVTNRYTSPPGERRFVPLANLASTTDDRGVYRIYGLAAGEYAVMAQVRLGPGFDTAGDLQEISPAEVGRALSEVRPAFRAPSRPGLPPPPPPSPATPEPRRAVALAPVFYPGTHLSANARMIKVAASEERRGIDFVADYVPTATVRGFVTMFEGSTPPRVILTSQNGSGFDPPRNAQAGADGAFSISGVPPGTYTVTARTGRSSAATQITVSGDDLEAVTLALQPGVTLAGRIEFEGSGAKPAGLPGTRIPFPPALMSGGTLGQLSVQLAPDLTFHVPDLVPGPLRFFAPLQGVRRSIGSWWLKSITIRGRDILDAPLEFRDNVDDAVITFTDRVNELSGRVNAPLGDGGPYVVVFSVDRTRWFHQSRAVDGIRPAPDGRYSIRNLPAGDYYVALVGEVENMEWFDPMFLDGIAPRAARVTIPAEGVTPFDVSPMK